MITLDEFQNGKTRSDHSGDPVTSNGKYEQQQHISIRVDDDKIKMW